MRRISTECWRISFAEMNSCFLKRGDFVRQTCIYQRSEIYYGDTCMQVSGLKLVTCVIHHLCRHYLLKSSEDKQSKTDLYVYLTSKTVL